MSTLGLLVDPSNAPKRKPPREIDGWVTAASGSWVVPVDNVSGVTVWWSDSLGRAVSGEGDVRRKLYTDADVSVFNFRQVIILNGIDLGAIRDDLAERLLTVELNRIDEHDRRYEEDIAQTWDEVHPRLGARSPRAAEDSASRLGGPPRCHLRLLHQDLSASDDRRGAQEAAAVCGRYRATRPQEHHAQLHAVRSPVRARAHFDRPRREGPG